LHKLAYSRE